MNRAEQFGDVSNGMDATWPEVGKGRCYEAFGNGTTAVYAALLALGVRDAVVAVPATICPSVVGAVFASGNRPMFVDIELETFGLDPRALAACIARLGAVIAVHAFGTPCRIDDIAVLCREAGVPLIEDCAQAEGARVDGEHVGQFGDVAVFSTGAGKIIDAGGGGGAVTANTALAAEIANVHRALPAFVDCNADGDLAHFFKFIYNRFYPDRLEHYRELFTDLMRSLGPRLLATQQPRLTPGIADGRRALSANIAARRHNESVYTSLLRDVQGVTLLPLPGGAVPWRYNVLLPRQVRDTVLSALLCDGCRVSSWYPDMSRFLCAADYELSTVDNSRWLDERVLNLWLDPSSTAAEISAVVLSLKKRLSEVGFGTADMSAVAAAKLVNRV